MNTTDIECLVIGAGLIGLSVARSISQRGKSVVLIEKNKYIGQENSSRNSGVIHAGIYYKTNTLKSKLCRVGNKKLYSYAFERGIRVDNCEKLIICNKKENRDKLLKVNELAKKNNVKLLFLDKKQVKKIEPNIKCEYALLSDSTGIINTHELMNNFLLDIENYKGTLVLNTEIHKIKICDDFFEFETKCDNQIFRAKNIINCSGINSAELINKIVNLKKKKIPRIIFIKGSYFKLNQPYPFNRLIYPLPSQTGLGIHSTKTFSDETLFGPDSEIVSNINYKIDEEKVKSFTESISQYWPDIKKKVLKPDYSGIRTKSENDDFEIVVSAKNNSGSLINLMGIDSPGLTSSIPLGEYVSAMI
mgnify:CR=1 FL=1